ncbi:hypothetical protein ABBQ38_006821 [Trebouxia sp. C0009 RCD-2024]
MFDDPLDLVSNDMWALGALLAFMLTGRNLFATDDPHATQLQRTCYVVTQQITWAMSWMAWQSEGTQAEASSGFRVTIPADAGTSSAACCMYTSSQLTLRGMQEDSAQQEAMIMCAAVERDTEADNML